MTSEAQHLTNLEELRRRALALLAGDRGAHRARRGREPGWVRWLSDEDVRSFHEVCHAVVAHHLGFTVYELSIVERRDIKMGPGYHQAGLAAFGDTEVRPPRKPYTELPSDEEQLRSLIFALACADEENVPATRQCLEAEVDEILEANWLLICTCASELCREKTLSQERIAKLLNAHPRRESNL